MTTKNCLNCLQPSQLDSDDDSGDVKFCSSNCYEQYNLLMRHPQSMVTDDLTPAADGKKLNGNSPSGSGAQELREASLGQSALEAKQEETLDGEVKETVDISLNSLEISVQLPAPAAIPVQEYVKSTTILKKQEKMSEKALKRKAIDAAESDLIKVNCFSVLCL